MGCAFPDVVKGGGGRGRQSLRSVGESGFGLSWRTDGWYQPSAAATTTAASTATTTATTRSPVVGLVNWSDSVRGGAPSAAVSRHQLPAKSDVSRGSTATLSVAARPGSSPILTLPYDRPQVLDAGSAVAVAVQKGHPVAHG